VKFGVNAIEGARVVAEQMDNNNTKLFARSQLLKTKAPRKNIHDCPEFVKPVGYTPNEILSTFRVLDLLNPISIIRV